MPKTDELRELESTAKRKRTVRPQPCSVWTDAAMESKTVTLPGMRTVNPLNSRQIWQQVARRASDQRSAAYLSMRAAQPIPTLPVVVTLTRVGPKPLDSDNLAASLKPCRDGIADAYGVKDNDPRITFAYDQRKGAYAVEIEIERKA